MATGKAPVIMRDSIRLGRILSIPVGLHWSVALLAGMVGFTLFSSMLPLAAPGYSALAYLPVAAAVAVALLASIIAHELGHSVVARGDGMNVPGITLFALGGVARLEGEPSTPGAAAKIALAGPAVSVAIGAASFGAWALASSLGLPALVGVGLLLLGLANVGMAVFNMIPALPLDGGRVLQAILWHRKGDTDRATISAAKVGRYLGWGIVALGLWSLLSGGSGLWTMLIGWFVVSGARAESLRAKFRIRSRTWSQPLWWQRFASSAADGPGAGGFGPRAAGPADFDPGFGPVHPNRRGPVMDIPVRPQNP